jgi:hypothetical protein
MFAAEFTALKDTTGIVALGVVVFTAPTKFPKTVLICTVDRSNQTCLVPAAKLTAAPALEDDSTVVRVSVLAAE